MPPQTSHVRINAMQAFDHRRQTDRDTPLRRSGGGGGSRELCESFKPRAGRVRRSWRSGTGKRVALKAECASLVAKGRQVETEAAPMRCVAELSAPTPTVNAPSGG
jgi:hypothetical protein